MAINNNLTDAFTLAGNNLTLNRTLNVTGNVISTGTISGSLVNASQSIISSVSPGSDTYITPSYPITGLATGNSFKIELYGTSSVSTVTVTIRCGNAGTTSDTSLLTINIPYPIGGTGLATFYARCIITFRSSTSAIAAADYNMNISSTYPGNETIIVGSVVTGLTPTYLGASVNSGTIAIAVISQIR